MLTQACATFGWSVDYAKHGVALNQLFAMLACHAWGQGMEVAAANYEDRDIDRIVSGKLKR